MKTLWQRLQWALVGYKTRPWTEPLPPLPPAEPKPGDETVESVERPVAKGDPFGHNMGSGGIFVRASARPGIFSQPGTQQEWDLRQSVTLAVDLLAPHFQSAFSAELASIPNAIGSAQDSGHESFQTTEIAMTKYIAPGGVSEQIDVLASGAAWLASAGGMTEARALRMFEVAVRDIYHP